MDDHAGPASKKRRKGQKTRIQEAEAVHNPPVPPSALATQLLKDWAWGRITIQYAQQTAHNALADMQHFDGSLPDLAVLAGLGTSGRHSNNMHRDIVNHIKSSLPKPFFVTWQAKMFWPMVFIPYIVFLF